MEGEGSVAGACLLAIRLVFTRGQGAAEGLGVQKVVVHSCAKIICTRKKHC